MQGVHVRNQDRRSQNDKKNMSKQEIGAPQRHLNDLDDELASGLGHGRRSEATSVPFTCPPGTICFVVFEFTSQEYGNEDFLDGALNGDDGNDTQYSV